MKNIKIFKVFNLLFSLVVISISLFVYTSFFGNPVSYLNAKHEINKYINEKYQNNIKLNIDSISYNSKMNGYGAKVSHEANENVSSYIYYHNTGNISDYYQFDIKQNMENEIKNTIVMLISQNTKFNRNSIDVEPSIDIKEFKYSLVDNYSGMESIDLKINIKSPSVKELKYYNNKKEFAKDVEIILNELEKIDFNFNSIDIYSYREDGNSSYCFRLEKDEISNSNINALDKVYIKEYIKEEEI